MHLKNALKKEDNALFLTIIPGRSIGWCLAPYWHLTHLYSTVY